jgi:uncharacterized HAD superfamily protein
MTIAIDIDEVLSKLMPKFLEFYNKIHKTSFSYEKFYSYDWNKMLGITNEKKCEIYGSFCDLGNLKRLDTIEGSVAGVKQIKERHKLVIITNRAVTLKNDTEHWLAKHFSGCFTKVIYTRKKLNHPAKSKQEICQRIKADIMIEDDPYCLKDLANSKIKLLLFNHPWNQNVNMANNIVRVHSWEQIVEEVNKI